MAGNYGSTGLQYRRNFYRGGRQAPKVHSMHPSSRWMWQPAIPRWERKFCQEVGLFQWDDFKEAKKGINLFGTKVMEWDDYAVKHAFHNAKNRFKAILDGHPTSTHDGDEGDFLGYANMYLDDEIDSEEDLQLYLEIDQICYKTKEDEDEDEEEEMPTWRSNIRIEDIVPTGWDVDMHEINKQINNPDLSGMIVGE